MIQKYAMIDSSNIVYNISSSIFNRAMRTPRAWINFYASNHFTKFFTKYTINKRIDS